MKIRFKFTDLFFLVLIGLIFYWCYYCWFEMKPYKNMTQNAKDGQSLGLVFSSLAVIIVIGLFLDVYWKKIKRILTKEYEFKL